MSADPFGTAALRERALVAWTASPVRLREDGNSEDDAALGAYQDRLVVELAQNAADAARRAGVPGRLHLLIDGDVLYAANPGTPLDPAGVEALSHRRASTKAVGEVGRYGVGFAAVLSLCDEPALFTSDAGVQWSRRRTAAVLAERPELAGQLERRDGAVPVMRMPWTADAPDARTRELLHAGNATVVRLPLRDEDAARRARELLEAVDPLLPLFLDVDELVVDGPDLARRIRATRRGDEVHLDADGAGSDWLVHRAAGDLDGRLLADRPVEERERASWSVAWAVRMVDGRPVPHDGDRRLRAPQPVDEVVDLPVLLCASLPLDIGRRNVVAGQLADAVLRHAAIAYCALLERLDAGPWLVDLLPSTLPAGPADLRLRDELATLLPRTRLLRSAGDDEVRLRPEEAHVLDVGAASDPLTALLAPHSPRLVDPAHSAGGRRQAALTALGVRLLDTADVVEVLGAVDAPPGWWGDVLVALAVAPDRDALRALPLPLADGTVAVGVGQLVLPGAEDVAQALEAAGLRIRRVHPDAVRSPVAVELLRGLGARDPAPAGFLDDPRLRVLVEAALDDDDCDVVALADAVLTVLARAPELGATRPWLADLPLPDVAGETRPAGELLLPTAHGGRLDAVMDPAGPFGVVDEEVVQRHGADAVTAAGVLRTFATASEDDVVVGDGGLEAYLDGADEWLAEVAEQLPAGDEPWVLTNVAAVRDLELVEQTPRAWAAALDELGRELARVVVEPVVAVRGAARAEVASYTSWWLRRHACVPGDDRALHPPDRLAAPGSSGLLSALYPAAAALSPSAIGLLDHLGLVRDPDQLDFRQVTDALARLGANGARLGSAAVRAGYAALLRRAEVVGAAPPELVCAQMTAQLVAVPRIDAVVVDAPDLLPLLGPLARVPASLDDARALAELLDVDLATEAVAGEVVSRPVRQAQLDPGRLPAGWDSVPREYAVHEGLRCAEASGEPIAVGWRVDAGGVHVDAGDIEGGLARAIAWNAGRWRDRHLVAALIRADADVRARLLEESELD